MATVSIPLLFKDLTGGVRRTEAGGATVREVIAGLEEVYPGIAARICDRDRLLPTVRVTVDGSIAAEGLATPVGPASEVCLLPSFGGG